MRGSERFTQRASTAITKAHDAAMGMGHSYVGTEHLLLGIIREGEGLGARILTDNALFEYSLKVQKTAAFFFRQLFYGNSRPACDDFLYVSLSYFKRIRGLLLLISDVFLCFQLFAELLFFISEL